MVDRIMERLRRKQWHRGGTGKSMFPFAGERFRCCCDRSLAQVQIMLLQTSASQRTRRRRRRGGILKADWFQKHRQRRPAVAALFLNWWAGSPIGLMSSLGKASSLSPRVAIPLALQELQPHRHRIIVVAHGRRFRY